MKPEKNTFKKEVFDLLVLGGYKTLVTVKSLTKFLSPQSIRGESHDIASNGIFYSCDIRST